MEARAMLSYTPALLKKIYIVFLNIFWRSVWKIGGGMTINLKAVCICCFFIQFVFLIYFSPLQNFLSSCPYMKFLHLGYFFLT